MEADIRASPVPVVIEFYGGERRLGFGESWIDLQRAHGRDSRFRGCLVRGNGSEDGGADDRIAIGQGGVGEGILGVFARRLFKIMDGRR